MRGPKTVQVRDKLQQAAPFLAERSAKEKKDYVGAQVYVYTRDLNIG